MEQRKNHHNGANGGFMLGVIIGVILTLLFTTKKGRDILKEITEKGLDKFSDLEKRLQQTEEDEFDTFVEEEENDYIKPDQPTRHLADAQIQPKEEATKKVPEKKEPPRVVHHTVEVKEEPAPPAKHESEPQKEAPKKSGVRRFFRLKK